MDPPRSTIVLGATAGLAQATLARLACSPLVLHGRDAGKLERLQAGLDGPAAVVAGEITDPGLAGRLWQAALDLPGAPSALVCFAGAPFRLPAEQWTAAALGEAFAVNSAAPLLLARDFCARLRAAGRPGNVVLLSTMQALYPFEGSLFYAASKAGLERGVEILAKEFGGQPPVRVNAIAPGVNQAGMALASIEQGKYRPYLDAGTISRYGQPEDVARAVEFLLDPELYMTGQTLLLDGGLTLRRDLR